MAGHVVVRVSEQGEDICCLLQNVLPRLGNFSQGGPAENPTTMPASIALMNVCRVSSFDKSPSVRWKNISMESINPQLKVETPGPNPFAGDPCLQVNKHHIESQCESSSFFEAFKILFVHFACFKMI